MSAHNFDFIKHLIFNHHLVFGETFFLCSSHKHKNFTLRNFQDYIFYYEILSDGIRSLIIADTVQSIPTNMTKTI